MKYFDIARRVINHEIAALRALEAHIFSNKVEFNKVVTKILQGQGKLILTGIGKSGHIARKIAASFSSTGTPACYIHPTEASHGDLGLIALNDLVLVFSSSGENSELVSLLLHCNQNQIYLVGITMNTNSVLAKNSNIVLSLPKFGEVSEIIAPTASSLMMLALGDALMTAVHESKNFTKNDYHHFHPGGKIGINLTAITEVMLPRDQMPMVQINEKTDLALEIILRNKLGGAVVVDHDYQLRGTITFEDVISCLTHFTKDIEIKDIMQSDVSYIASNVLLQEALDILNTNNIILLPVCDDNNRVTGMVHQNLLFKYGLK